MRCRAVTAPGCPGPLEGPTCREAQRTRQKTFEEKKAVLLPEWNRLVSIARAASSAAMREQLRVRGFPLSMELSPRRSARAGARSRCRRTQGKVEGLFTRGQPGWS